MLIHQKSTYEVIKDELINYDFHATTTSSKSETPKIENYVNKAQFNGEKSARFQKKSWKSQGRSAKFNNTPNRFTKSNIISECNFCGKFGHIFRDCRSRLRQSNQSNQSSQSTLKQSIQ